MKDKKIPMRQCNGCRQEKAKIEMIRVVRTPDDEVLIDKTGKLNGRGAYICNCSECLNLAIKNKGIARSLKINLSDEIIESLKEMANNE